MASVQRRRQNRAPRMGARPVKITRSRPEGGTEEIPARLIDCSEGGLGVECAVAMPVGSRVRVASAEGLYGRIGAHRAYVRWCKPVREGMFQAGLQFEDDAEGDPPPKDQEPRAAAETEAADHYEILQLNPRADPDTIHRVFRMLAQRYHPDNRESGDEETFKQLLAAYDVLSDPEKRAAFDAKRLVTNKARWRVFDQPRAAVGVDAEKSKRRAVLSLLYTKRMNVPEQPHMGLHELEDLLGCPREHLEFTLWYLKESALVTRLDNGRYGITARGVDHAEESGLWRGPSEAKMLPSAEPVMTR